MSALNIAAWALVAYVAFAIIGGAIAIIAALVIRRRALREFEQRRKDVADPVRTHRGRFKL